MTRYIVHMFREMRVTFADIDADTPEAAAAIGLCKTTDEADDIEECNGEDLSAVVDLAGDEDYGQSVTIDFEPERIRKSASALLEALEYVRATLKLRHLDEATDDEVEEALNIGQTAIAQATESGVIPRPAETDASMEA